MRYLVDSSVLTRLAKPAVREAIEPGLGRGEFARAGISGLEVGYSARDEDEWDRLSAALDQFELVETTSADVRRAKQVQRLLAAKHQRGRKVPDLLVAAAAETAGLIVLHYDTDFDRIAAVTGQSCQWVVAPGTAD